MDTSTTEIKLEATTAIESIKETPTKAEHTPVKSQEHVFITSTGVRVDLRNAIEVLLRFCQQRTLDKRGIQRPVFWMCTGYRCAVLLPSTVDPTCRCVFGPLASRKSAAKAAAALECIKVLHFRGEIGDDLGRSVVAPKPPATLSTGDNVPMDTSTPPSPPSSSSNAPVYETDSAPTDLLSTGTCGTAAAAADDESVSVSVKIIPDSITASMLQQSIAASSGTDNCDSQPRANVLTAIDQKNTLYMNSKVTRLYLYALRAYPCDPDPAEVKAYLSCDSCSPKVSNLNRIGIALPSAAPAGVFADNFNMFLRSKYPLSAHIQYLGPRDVSDEELLQMQVSEVTTTYCVFPIFLVVLDIIYL